MLLYLFALRVPFSVFISLLAAFGSMAPNGHFEMHYRRCAGDVFSNFPSETVINSAILIRIFALDQSILGSTENNDCANNTGFRLNYLSLAVGCHYHISFYHSHLHTSCWFMFCAERQ